MPVTTSPLPALMAEQCLLILPVWRETSRRQKQSGCKMMVGYQLLGSACAPYRAVHCTHWAAEAVLCHCQSRPLPLQPSYASLLFVTCAEVDAACCADEAKLVLEHTVKLSDVQDPLFYDAIFVPGGHGPVLDLAQSDLLADMLSKAATAGGLVRHKARRVLLGSSNPLSIQDGLPYSTCSCWAPQTGHQQSCSIALCTCCIYCTSWCKQSYTLLSLIAACRQVDCRCVPWSCWSGEGQGQ